MKIPTSKCKTIDIPNIIEQGGAFHLNALKDYYDKYGWHEVFDRMKNIQKLKDYANKDSIQA